MQRVKRETKGTGYVNLGSIFDVLRNQTKRKERDTLKGSVGTPGLEQQHRTTRLICCVKLGIQKFPRMSNVGGFKHSTWFEFGELSHDETSYLKLVFLHILDDYVFRTFCTFRIRQHSTWEHSNNALKLDPKPLRYIIILKLSRFILKLRRFT